VACEAVRQLLCVGLNTANEGRLSGLQTIHENVKLVAELDSQTLLLGIRVDSCLEKLAKKVVLGSDTGLVKTTLQNIAVLFNKAVDVVGNVTSVVQEDEAVLQVSVLLTHLGLGDNTITSGRHAEDLFQDNRVSNITTRLDSFVDHTKDTLSTTLVNHLDHI